VSTLGRMTYGGGVVLTVVAYFALISIASFTASSRWNSALGYVSNPEASAGLRTRGVTMQAGAAAAYGSLTAASVRLQNRFGGSKECATTAGRTRPDQARRGSGAEDSVQTLTSYTIARYVAFAGLGAGALLILGPMASPTVGHWLSSMGLISGVTAERMAWGPIWLFGTLIPGSIAICVGLVALTIAIVVRLRDVR
jgi:hypothetical protein